MSEIHRSLKPGGVFLAITPAYPSSAAFQDPTHVNIISKDTIHYFTGNHPWGSDLGYGFIGQFEIVTSEWLKGVGPLSNKRLIHDFTRGQRVAKFYILAQLVRRYLLTLKKSKPTHLIWVIQKKGD